MFVLDRVLSVPALQRVIAALEGEGPPSSLGGVWGSASALILASLHGFLKRPLFLVVPSEGEEMVEDLQGFGISAPLLPEAVGEARHLASERLRLALEFQTGRIPALVATAKSAGQPFPSARERLRLRTGERHDPVRLADRLVDAAFDRVHAVEGPGEFAARGGILDLFPLGAARPVRLDFFGDTLESIREFSVGDQRSERSCEEVSFGLGGERSAAIADFLPPRCWAAVREPGEAILPPLPIPTLELSSLPGPGENVKTLSLQRFSGTLSNIAQELDRVSGDVRIYCANEGEEQRFRELLRDAEVKRKLEIVRGRLSRGFTFEEIGASFLPHHELFHRYRLRRSISRRSDARPIDSLLELEKGDIVVHVYHGIGRFVGMQRVEGKEFMTLEYADGTRVFVPVADLDLVQKYVGASEHAPALHALGGTSWATAKERAAKAVEELAEEMIRIQAVREMEVGTAYPPDTDWDRAFELGFPYEETEDQLEIARQIKLDLRSPRPMDRLICGDVGYGKTELAMRGAFKVATANRQVAVLVPTTVLAQQHFRTFTERMADYPIRIDVISRFRTDREQKAILASLAEGAIDIIIGTHRLLQKDVRFKDLGLAVVDEEQRFGVEHKEHLKNLRATVDVLTLSATPIPRTLHMSLLGIRDISALQTPPQDRRAILTEVMLYDERRIRNAILSEMDRGGQVYFVHNRVYNIESVRQSLERIVPEARFAVGHGQMGADELERTMIDFLEKRTDVLVCTTIIESGLDIPNVNTIFLNNADHFGLADLHQLRGRVGRYTVQAYCYLLLPRDRPILPQAKKRIKAIEEFSELGAGFKIAMRDLEIRGVGNLLGREQSGHIAAIGYDLYVKLLERATRKKKNLKVEEPMEAAVDLDTAAYLPESYAPDLRSRVELYRHLTACRTEAELETARRDMEDRFGKPPLEVENFLHVLRVKQLCRMWEIASLSRGQDAYVGRYRNRKKAEQLRALKPTVRIVDEQTLWIPTGADLGETLTP